MNEIKSKNWNALTRLKVTNEQLTKIIPLESRDWILPITYGDTFIQLKFDELKDGNILLDRMILEIYKEGDNIYIFNLPF